MEFTRQLPKMHSLKYVRFGSYSWQVSENACNTLGNALLQHIMENTCIESVDELDCFPQAPLLWHCLVLNRAGRRFLTSSHPIPDGLWSHVFERASDEKRYTIDEVDDIASDDKRYTNGEMGGSVATEGVHIARYNAVYFLVQNFPKILGNTLHITSSSNLILLLGWHRRQYEPYYHASEIETPISTASSRFSNALLTIFMKSKLKIQR